MSSRCEQVLAAPQGAAATVAAAAAAVQHKGEEVSVPVDVVISREEEDCGMARRRWDARMPYEDDMHDMKSAMQAECTPVNLNGVVVIVFVLVAVSWLLDELWDASHAGDVHASFLGSLLLPQHGAHASVQLMAKLCLGICVMFIVAVWTTSAYIKVRYLTPAPKERPGAAW